MNDKEELVTKLESIVKEFRKLFSNVESSEESRRHLFIELSRLTGWSIKWSEAECLFNGFHKPNFVTSWHLWEMMRLFDLHCIAFKKARHDYEIALKDMYEYTIMQLSLRQKESEGKVEDFDMLQLHLFEKEDRLSALENELKKKDDFQLQQAIELKTLKEQLDFQVKKNIRDQGETFSLILKENTSLKDENQKLKKKLERLEAERERIDDSLAILKAQMKHVKTECIQLQSDLLDEKEIVKSLRVVETRNRKLENAVSELEQKLQMEKRKGNNLEDTLKMSEMQLWSEKELNAELRGQAKILEGVAEKQKEFDNIREELKQHRVWRSLVQKVVTQEPWCLST